MCVLRWEPYGRIGCFDVSPWILKSFTGSELHWHKTSEVNFVLMFTLLLWPD